MYLSFIKRYKLSLICIAAIWILCLGPVPSAPELEDVPFIDKWVHTAMYLGTCSIIWAEYLLCHRRGISWRKLLIWAVIAPLAMSGLIELLQAYCTGGRRSGDILDFAANAIGVILAAILSSTLLRKVLAAIRR